MNIEANFAIRFGWLLGALRQAAGKYCKEVAVPAFVPGDARDSWAIDFYGETAHLASSNALHLSAFCAEVGNCFCLQKVFRKERKETPFHLSEFLLLECAVVGIDCEQSMRLVENIVRDVHYAAVSEFGKDEVTDIPEQCFEKVAWREAVEKYHSIEKIDFDHSPGASEMGDLSHPKTVDSPIFFFEMPREQVSWACKVASNETKKAFNLLVPRIGEIAEGGERETSSSMLRMKFIAAQRVKQLSWYSSAMEHIKQPLCVFAIGVERLAMWLFKCDDISEVNLYPRKMHLHEIV